MIKVKLNIEVQMDYNIPEVSADALISFRKSAPEIIREVVERSMQKKDEVFQHGDETLEILTSGIDMTTRMLDNAMAINERHCLMNSLNGQ